MIGPTDLLHPSPAPHRFICFKIYCFDTGKFYFSSSDTVWYSGGSRLLYRLFWLRGFYCYSESFQANFGLLIRIKPQLLPPFISFTISYSLLHIDWKLLYLLVAQLNGRIKKYKQNFDLKFYFIPHTVHLLVNALMRCEMFIFTMRQQPPMG